MPFEIVRNDITLMRADAIVNTANPEPVVGFGADSAIHQKAGPELLRARQSLGAIKAGDAAITAAYGLDARYVIHTVGPVWNGGNHGEARILRSCYDKSLLLAQKKRCKSVAFPLISTGNYGFPKDLALQIAAEAFTEFLAYNEMQIYLVVFDRNSYKLSQQRFDCVSAYIDQHYVDQIGYKAIRQVVREENIAMPSCPAPCASMAAPKAMSLEDMLKQEDAGFTETLLQLIDRTGKKDSEIYKKANLSKQHFSKIRNNPHYKPTKATAVALALALELNLEETRDLIGRAGYALTNSSKFDLIIRFFIESRIYNIVEINMTLYEFDQVLLGA